MAIALIDSYPTSNHAGAYAVTEGADHFIGQSFTCSRSWILDSCKFYITRDNVAVTENMVALLTTHSGTYGTSSIVGTEIASSDAISASTLDLLSMALVTFSFSGANRIRLSPNTYYCIGLYRYAGSNNLQVAEDTSSPAHSGNKFTYMTASPNDIIFYVYGEETVPTVTTQACSSVTHNSAVGNGNITIAGGLNVTRRGFCYKVGTSGDPTTSDSTVYDDGTFTEGAYTKAITGLSATTGYRVRAYAVNAVGTSYGTTIQLTTQGADAPVVSTTTTSRLDRKCVIFGGNVTDEGSQAVTERGIYYGTDEFSQTNKLTSTSGLGTYSIFLSGLTPNTKYYYKAFATSSIGTSYGDILNFTTGNSLAVNDKTALPPFNRA